MGLNSIFLLLLLLLLLHNVIAAANTDPLSDRRHRHAIAIEKAALLTFKSTLTSASQSVLSNWNASTGVCDFIGIRCNRWRLHVTYIQLNRTSLQGPLSPYLANLTSLRELDLSDNLLNGHIPSELANLRRLSFLELSGNHLDGAIPESLAVVSNLAYLDLSNNLLTGQIPASILYNCSSLGIIDLSTNALSGEVPSLSQIHLPRLLLLNLYLNNLHGKIPSWLSNSSILQELDIENNHLSGDLPTETVSNMNQLNVLHLSYNDLSSHDNNTNLNPFFVALSNCSELRELEVAGMGLGGHLPSKIGRAMIYLSTIYLDDNKIFGPIPHGIANFTSLTLLELSNNLLNGSIPEEISKLPSLERLIMSHNFFSGTIPTAIGSISSLGLLDLSNNMFSGEIPAGLGNLCLISEIYLQKNQLTGAIPASIGKCTTINKLDLSYNKLTGSIPHELSGIAKIYLNLSNNQLQGPLPIELSKMDQVEEIDLSSNNLSGQLIPQLSDCVEIKLINLSHNSFKGQLPASFGDLKNLEVLDVSFNSLSGEIPLSLTRCAVLTRLNLSYNNFDGEIPIAGSFSNFTGLSYRGNTNLCGSVSGHSCPEHTRQSKHSRMLLIKVCAIASIGAFALTVCCVIGVIKIRKRILSKKCDADVDNTLPVMISNYPRITYRELSDATDGFNQDRLVGSGSYGRVYKGVRKDGTIIAVKVLQLQTGNSTRSFTRECQVLKRIRHRNLMRIVTACSLPDFKALVLPFMSNGSLESHLHQSSGSSDLSLMQRVNICSDVAEGMAYLHHHSPVKVIHCDLKPSNVLLNDEMTALVSDFGIARLVMTVGVGATASADNVGSSTANMLCGSIGYIAPEYGYGSNPSTKGDVYSFGVLVLEVVTRRRPTDEMFEGGLSLHKWVKIHYHGRGEKVIDSTLLNAARDQTPEVKNMWEVAIGELLELGLLCTQESPSTRPTMLDAADDLDRLKRYLSGDTTVTFASSLEMSSCTFGEDYTDTSVEIFG